MGLGFDIRTGPFQANVISTASSVSNLVGAALDFANTCVDTAKWIFDDRKTMNYLQSLFQKDKPKTE